MARKKDKYTDDEIEFDIDEADEDDIDDMLEEL